MKLLLTAAVVALLCAPALSGNLRGPGDDERELAGRKRVGIQGVNTGRIWFGPSPVDTGVLRTVECPAGHYIKSITLCGRSWVRGVAEIQCQSGTSPKVTKVPNTTGSCSTAAGNAAHRYTITAPSNGFNGATAFKAVDKASGKSFSSGLIFSYANQATSSQSANGFSEIVGSRVTDLALYKSYDSAVRKSLNRITMPWADNSVKATDGQLDGGEFGYCGKPLTSRITALHYKIGAGTDDVDGGGTKDFVTGFGVSCKILTADQLAV